MSELGKALRDALKRPEDWLRDGLYTLHHTPSGVCLWIGNGPLFFDIYNGAGRIGLLERWRLYFQAQRVLSRQTAAKLRGGNHAE